MTARAAQCKCGVHGFAMNPCDSLPTATAPYYREARVTVVWRQTAYRMRHCFARRIDETGDRRKLVCTSNKIGRAAADDRSKSNRLATPNAATPRAGIPIPEAQRPFEPETANLKPFSRGIKRGILSFVKESIPLCLVQRPRRCSPLQTARSLFHLA